MIEWITLVPAVCIGALILVTTGAPVAWSLGARGFSFIVAAVPAAFASIALTSIAAPFLGLSWSIWLPLAFTALLTVVLRFTRPLKTSRAPTTPNSSSKQWVWPAVAVATAAVISVSTLLNSIKSPESISQSYDAVFHLNATRHVLETGLASPLTLDIAAPGSPSFYPTLWHASAALIAQLSGVSVPAATNAFLIVVVALVSPIGAIALARSVAGSGKTATLTAGIFAASFPLLPLGLAGFGVLYPNLLSMVLVPYALVGLTQLFGVSPSRDANPLSPIARWLLTLGALGAATLAHPNALHVTWLLALGLPIWLLVRVCSRGASMKTVVGAVIIFAAYIGVGGALWVIGRTTLNPWGGSQGPFGAVIEALGTAPRLAGHNWVVTLFLLGGILLALRRTRLLPSLIALITSLGFYVIAEGFSPSPWREVFLSPWYSDPWRLAAILPIAMLPLAVVGAKTFVSIIRPVIVRVGQALLVTRKRAVSMATTLLILAGFAVAGTSLTGVADYLARQYDGSTETARVLSPNEHALLDRLPEIVPEDASIFVNPWNGSSLAYALTGRNVLLPHMSGSYSNDIWVALDGIVDGTVESCDVAETLGASYVLDFGTEYIFKNPDFNPALKNISAIDDAPALTEVDREGDAVLYEITGCNWKE